MFRPPHLAPLHRGSPTQVEAPHSGSHPTCAHTCAHVGGPVHDIGHPHPRVAFLPQHTPYSWLQAAVSGTSTLSSTAGLVVAMLFGMGAVSSVSLQCGVRSAPAASPDSSERMARSPHSVPSCEKAQHSGVSPGQGPHTRDEAPSAGDGVGDTRSQPLWLTLGCGCVVDPAGLGSGGPARGSMLAASAEVGVSTHAEGTEWTSSWLGAGTTLPCQAYHPFPHCPPAP